MARQKKNIKEKVEKEYPEFVVEVNSMGLPELEKRLSTCAKQMEEVQSVLDCSSENPEHQKAVTAISSTKTVLKEMTGPFTDCKKALKLKTKYLIETIKDKGGEA